MSYSVLAKIKHFEAEFMHIKQEAGTHSPSMSTLRKNFPDFKIKIDACFLSNPYATDLVMEYLQKELLQDGNLRDVLEHYPSQQNALCEEFAKALHVKPEHLFIGNGAIEIIQALMQQVVEKKVVVPIPTFSSYYEFAREDTEVVYYELDKQNNYEFDVAKFADFIQKENPDTVILINPNNPNGAYMNQDKMRALLRALEDVKQVIIDESFIHFAYENEDMELVDSLPLFYEFDNVIIVKSLSKDFGVAGVRLGYALMQESLVKKLLAKGYLWNLNGIAETILKFFSQNQFQKRYEVIRKEYILECQNFFKGLENIEGLHVYPSQANFALIQLPSYVPSSLFVAFLLCEYGIYVRTANDKIGLNGECVRIAVRRAEENEQMLDAITQVMKQFSKEIT